MAQRVVVIGGVAAGPKAACRLKRLNQEAEITIIDQSKYISYGGCGIPYFISDDIPNEKELMSTSFHVVRDKRFFREAKGIEVLMQTRALNIDRRKKEVEVEDLKTKQKSRLPYDKLVLATGSEPVQLPIPGIELRRVFSVSNITSALNIKNTIIKNRIGKAAIIGGGAIGVEMAEAIADVWDIETTVVEYMDHLLPYMFDWNFAQMVKAELEKHNVRVCLGERVERLEGDAEGNVRKVITNEQEIEAELVITCVGVRPNDILARKAGLAVAERGGIIVDKHLRTSDPDIYAGGDCIENYDLITGNKIYIPLGSLANRQGRVIGSNLAGKPDTFEGVVGSFIVKVFEISAGSVGLSLESAKRQNFDADRVLILGYDRAHYYPTKQLIYMQLVVDRPTQRVLGFQGIGGNNDAVSVRIDSMASILKGKPLVTEISNIEVAYSPPFASAMDTLNSLGNAAQNYLDGLYKRMEATEFCDFIKDVKNENAIVLDLNSPQAAKPYVERYKDRWINIPYMDVRSNIAKIPRDKKIITVCDSGIRSYEIQLVLEAAGFQNVVCLEGGLNLISKMGTDLLS